MTSAIYLDDLCLTEEETAWLNSTEFDLALIDLGVEKERLQVESDLKSRFYFERHARDYDLDGEYDF